MTNPTFITDEFIEDGQLVKTWIEIDEGGKVIANEHGAFTLKQTQTGEMGMCDYFGRTPGMTMVARLIQTAMMESRSLKIQ